MNHPFIFGIIGDGTEKVIRELRLETPHFVEKRFDDAPIAHCLDIFGVLCRDDVLDHSMVPVNMDDFLYQMSMRTLLSIKPLGWVARTPRQLLTAYTEHYVRKVDDSYWNKLLLGELVAPDFYAVPVSTTPQAEALAGAGAFLVRLSNGAYVGPNFACHLSFRHDGTPEKLREITRKLLAFSVEYQKRKLQLVQTLVREKLKGKTVVPDSEEV